MCPSSNAHPCSDFMRFFVSVNPESSVAVRTQVENLVLFRIASGELRPGDQLPSAGDIAAALSINPNTVFTAFHALKLKGIVESYKGRGAIVAEESVVRANAEVGRAIHAHIHEICGEARASGLSDREIVGAVRACLKEPCRPYSTDPKSLTQSGTC